MPTIGLNLPGASVARQMDKFTKELGDAQTALGSGLRVNNPAADPAAAAIGAKFTSQVQVLDQLTRNVSGGASVLNMVQGALDNIKTILTNMQQVATQATDPMLLDSGPERTALQSINDAFVNQIDALAAGTKWLGQTLLDGSFSGKEFQVGLDTATTVALSFSDAQASGLSVNSIDLTTQAGASAAYTAIEGAISTISQEIGKVAAFQKRFEAALESISTELNSQQAARDTIIGADVNQTLSDVTTLKAQIQVAQQMFLSTLEQQSNLAQMVQTARA